MDKIAKLNKDWLTIQAKHRDLYRKVDEIIDYLNQSQKQPEGYVREGDKTFTEKSLCKKEKENFNTELEEQPEGLTAGDVFHLRRLEAFAEDYNALKEKQEGLTRELTDKLQGVDKGVDREKQEEWRECPVCGVSAQNGNQLEIHIEIKHKKIHDFISQLLSERTRESKKEVLEKILEKKTNYKIKREEHGYRVTLEYVLADDIEKELDNIKQSNNNG